MKLLILFPLLVICTLLSMNYQADDINQGNIIIEIENDKVIVCQDEALIEKPVKRSKCLVIIPAIIITSLIAGGTTLIIHYVK